ncbi:type II toxin-antitoxin system HicA family toxin [Endothiovibrio diazotrophicus]
MRLPRDWTGRDLIRRLAPLGYAPTRQTGSHVRLTRETDNGQHHLTIPLHNPLRMGTLNHILGDAAQHLSITKEELLERLTDG